MKFKSRVGVIAAFCFMPLLDGCHNIKPDDGIGIKKTEIKIPESESPCSKPCTLDPEDKGRCFDSNGCYRCVNGKWVKI